MKQSITIPAWLIGIIITLFLTAIGVYGTAVSNMSTTKANIEECKLNLNDIKENVKQKAEKTEIDRIYRILERIENKLDNLK